MSEPRFGAWTATADRLPDTAGLVIGEWPDGETGPVCYSEFPGWMDGDCPMNPPVRWMPMPKPGETAGPGEAMKRVFEWPAIDRWAVAALSVLAKSGDRAVRGESAAEAFRRGKMEGYKLGVVDLLRRLGAVDVVDPTSCDHVGFAIGYGPGDATRRILSTLDRKQAEAAKTTEEYTLTVWPSPWGNREITYETVTAALRECGMEDKP